MERARVVFPIPPPPRIATRTGVTLDNVAMMSHISLSLPTTNWGASGKAGLKIKELDKIKV
jgi:hypothetical protein